MRCEEKAHFTIIRIGDDHICARRSPRDAQRTGVPMSTKESAPWHVLTAGTRELHWFGL
jgi:hypothetical protein